MELSINGLGKTYPNGVKALTDISLTLQQGVFGLLGPNGTGKSTLMRTLATLQAPDRGSLFLDELNILKHPDKLRRQLGYLPQDFGVYPRISAEQMLDHIARLKGIRQRDERRQLVAALLEQVNLGQDKKKNLGTYSGGMKQRFGIAQALIGQPKLIIVDEPTAGLDPAERNRFYNLLSRLGQDSIVLLSTHIVEDVSTLCAAFAIIEGGKVQFHGDPETAVAALRGRIYSKEIRPDELPDYHGRYRVISTQLKSGRTHLRIEAAVTPGNGFSPEQPSLEDVYFSHLNPASHV
jgi:ABC-type multidrug transport system ATPase subunit